MSVLVYVKSEKLLLKIQEGTGANLDKEDVDQGMMDYVLYSLFKPSALDIDMELEMTCVDEGGMAMSDREVTAEDMLPTCYEMALDRPYDEDDCVILFTDTDCEENME